MSSNQDPAGNGPAYPALGVAAKAIVVDDDGDVLLIKRSPRSKVDPLTWDLPGGKMDFGERLTDALEREVHEETGLVVRGDDARPIHISHFVKEPFWVTCVTFVCAAFAGEVHLSDEHVEHEWVAPPDRRGRDYARAIEEQLDAFATSTSDAEGVE